MGDTVSILLVIVATFIGAIGSIFLKKGADNLVMNLIKLIKNKDLYIGIVLFIFSSVFYVWALSSAELSLLYPITSLSYVWISFLSIRFLGEKMNNFKWLGITFIILGVFLITR